VKTSDNNKMKKKKQQQQKNKFNIFSQRWGEVDSLLLDSRTEEVCGLWEMDYSRSKHSL